MLKLNPRADHTKRCDFGELSLSEDVELVSRIGDLIKTCGRDQYQSSPLLWLP